MNHFIEEQHMTTDNKTTSDSALGIATAYHEAWTSGDLDKAMSFMAEDVIHEGHGGTHTSRSLR